MVHQGVVVLEFLAALGTLSSVGYYLLCLWGAVVFFRRKDHAGPAGPTPVSILKPLKGTDPQMYESFRSHCLQNVPEYEIIFGVSDPQDPAVELVHRLQAEFPQQTVRLVVCRENLGANVKVSNLVQMLREARHGLLVVNDSDIRVAPDYLRRVTAPLSNAANGLVTCLYRGVPGPTLGSQLESLGISTDFSGGVLAAQVVEGGIRFGLGSTLAFHRRDLQAIGGFEALADYLADDYEIGTRLAAQGRKVVLSQVVVETYLPHYTLPEFVRHQLRWARSVRDSRRWGYVGLVLTFGLPWALLTVALAHGAAWTWWLFGGTFAVRLLMALVVGCAVLKDRFVLPLLALLPLRDLLAPIIWVASFAGHTIAWRGGSFVLKDGKLARTES